MWRNRQGGADSHVRKPLGVTPGRFFLAWADEPLRLLPDLLPAGGFLGPRHLLVTESAAPDSTGCIRCLNQNPIPTHRLFGPSSVRAARHVKRACCLPEFPRYQAAMTCARLNAVNADTSTGKWWPRARSTQTSPDGSRASRGRRIASRHRDRWAISRTEQKNQRLSAR
jgi:hypothetical protein